MRRGFQRRHSRVEEARGCLAGRTGGWSEVDAAMVEVFQPLKSSSPRAVLTVIIGQRLELLLLSKWRAAERICP